MITPENSIVYNPFFKKILKSVISDSLLFINISQYFGVILKPVCLLQSSLLGSWNTDITQGQTLP